MLSRLLSTLLHCHLQKGAFLWKGPCGWGFGQDDFWGGHGGNKAKWEVGQAGSGRAGAWFLGLNPEQDRWSRWGRSRVSSKDTHMHIVSSYTGIRWAQIPYFKPTSRVTFLETDLWGGDSRASFMKVCMIGTWFPGCESQLACFFPIFSLQEELFYTFNTQYPHHISVLLMCLCMVYSLLHEQQFEHVVSFLALCQCLAVHMVEKWCLQPEEMKSEPER